MVAAGVLALMVNIPLFYLTVKLGDTSDQLRTLWDKTQDDALILITATRAKVTKRAKQVNDVKAWLLLVAMLAEVAGVVGIALAVMEVLKHG